MLGPLNISQTGKATIFKFGMHIGRGQFLPPDHKWPEIERRLRHVTHVVSRGGAYCGGHLTPQLVLFSIMSVTVLYLGGGALVVNGCNYDITFPSRSKFATNIDTSPRNVTDWY